MSGRERRRDQGMSPLGAGHEIASEVPGGAALTTSRRAHTGQSGPRLPPRQSVAGEDTHLLGSEWTDVLSLKPLGV